MIRPARTFFGPLLLVCLTALVAGCGDDGPTGTENTPPTADAGTDRTVAVGSSVTLDGTNSSDADGDQLSYSWILDTPEGSSASLANSSSAQAAFAPDVEGQYTAALTVSDASGEEDSDQVEVVAEESQEAVVLDGDITFERTLPNRFSDAERADYVVESLIGIRDDARLTIEEGVRIEFASGTGLFVAHDAASLVAVGTSQEPIVMTGTQQQPGFWRGLGFFSDNLRNEIEHVEIDYAGGSTYDLTGDDVPAGIALDEGAHLSLRRSTLRYSESYGLFAKPGADLAGFSSNEFTNHGDAPVYIPATAAGQIDGNSSFPNNDEAYVRVHAQDLTDDLTLTRLASGVPYRFVNTTAVVDGAQLTIEAGVNAVFEAGAGLRVDGTASSLVAFGTSSDPIVLTAAQQQPGFWRGIGIFSDNLQNEMSHVDVAYGGGDPPYLSGSDGANIALNDGTHLTLTNSSIRESDGWGVEVEAGATFDDSNNTYINNASGPVNE